MFIINHYTLYKYKLISLVFFIVLVSCNKDNEGPQITHSSLEILQNEKSALNALVKFRLSTDAEAYISYWPSSDNETMAKKTAVSSVKKVHSIPLFQLKEKTSYNFKVFSINGSETEVVSSGFTTYSMPTWVKQFYDESKNQIQENNDGFFLFHNMTKPGCLYLVDNKGEIAWYRTFESTIKAARFTPKNSLIVLLDELANPMADGNLLLETNLEGDTLFQIRKGEKGFDRMFHHDIQMNSQGHIVGITNEVKDGLPGDGLLALDTYGQKVWSWSTFDEIKDIDLSSYAQPWGNSLSIDIDNNYIVSFRSLCQVWKINASTGKVMWKLGKKGDLKVDAANEFMFQHFAHRNSDNEIMLFDNGSAARPTSRILSFNINETTKEAVTQINTSLPSNLYSMIMGSARLLPDGNILAASAVNGTIIKISKAGQLIWSLKTSSQIYRVDYIANPFNNNF